MDLDITFKNVLIFIWMGLEILSLIQEITAGSSQARYVGPQGLKEVGLSFFVWGWNFLISSVVPICQNVGQNLCLHAILPRLQTSTKLNGKNPPVWWKFSSFSTWKPESLAATIVREVLVLVVWKFSQEIHGELYFFPLSFLGALVFPQKTEWSSVFFLGKFQPFFTTSIFFKNDNSNFPDIWLAWASF